MFNIQVYSSQMADGSQNTICGREIHDALAIVKDYPTWVKQQIKRLNLVENVDYIVFHPEVENPLGGRPRIEHYFTIDIAKHIALASNSEKGREYRQALINLEKQVSTDTLPLIKNPATKIAIETLMRIDAMEQRQIEQDRAVAQAQRHALEALAAQQWVTIRQYVAIHQMTRQLPPGTEQQQYGRWLTGYCQEQGLPIYKQQSQQYQEWTYPVWTIQQTLHTWLARRHGQSKITGLQIQDDGIWYNTTG